MDYLIRSCREQDLPTLVLLCEQHACYEKVNYDSAGKQVLLMNALFSEMPKLFCLVVEYNDKIVGYASYTFDFSTWRAADFLYLDCLYLEPECRGFGIGEEIICKLKAIALERGCSEMQWQTPSFNEGAIKFYKRVGATGKEKIRFSFDVKG